jgi:hypothetical protein
MAKYPISARIIGGDQVGDGSFVWFMPACEIALYAMV